MINIPIAIVILFPMSLIRDMSGFRYVSIASIVALIYMGIVLLIELPEYFQYYHNVEGKQIEWAHFDLNLFGGAAITFFAYTCQIQLLPIYSELINPNERRIKKVVSRAIAVDIGFYLVIASAGYLSTFDLTDAIVLRRAPLPGQKVDYALLIAAVAIVLTLFVAVPVNYNPFRNMVIYMTYKREHFSNKENVLITAIFLACTCAIAIFFPNIAAVPVKPR